VPVYRRFRDRGPLAPTGLSYVSSSLHDELDRCYQLMETENRALLDKWIANWNDIIDFKVHPVISSKEESERVGPDYRRRRGSVKATLRMEETAA
jgi:hypothetical protein